MKYIVKKFRTKVIDMKLENAFNWILNQYNIT